MITQFKIYEKFSSKLLVTSIYNFLYKIFSDSEYTLKKNHNDVDILDEKDLDKILTQGGVYYTGRFNVFKEGPYMQIVSYKEITIEILEFISNQLKKYNINSRYKFNDSPYSKNFFLQFNIKDYDNVISIIDNCSTDELEAYISSKKYNL
jgi:hypothetical protein